MFSLLDATAVLLLATAILYYEGWLFLWLLRRQYAAHFSDIESPRELFLVIGAWSLNWYPFYLLFAAAVAGFVLAEQAASTYGNGAIWHALVVAGCFFLFHKITFRRARTVFLGSAREGFVFFPQVADLWLSSEVADDAAHDIAKAVVHGRFRVLARDSKKLVLFSTNEDRDRQTIEVFEIPVDAIRALRTQGIGHFRES